jgi:hypothetical protein
MAAAQVQRYDKRDRVASVVRLELALHTSPSTRAITISAVKDFSVVKNRWLHKSVRLYVLYQIGERIPVHQREQTRNRVERDCNNFGHWRSPFNIWIGDASNDAMQKTHLRTHTVGFGGVFWEIKVGERRSAASVHRPAPLPKAQPVAAIGAVRAQQI